MVLAVAEESVGMLSRGQEEAEASSIKVFSVRRIPGDRRYVDGQKADIEKTNQLV